MLSEGARKILTKMGGDIMPGCEGWLELPNPPLSFSMILASDFEYLVSVAMQEGATRSEADLLAEREEMAALRKDAARWRAVRSGGRVNIPDVYRIVDHGSYTSVSALGATTDAAADAYADGLISASPSEGETP